MQIFSPGGKDKAYYTNTSPMYAFNLTFSLLVSNAVYQISKCGLTKKLRDTLVAN